MSDANEKASQPERAISHPGMRRDHPILFPSQLAKLFHVLGDFWGSLPQSDAGKPDFANQFDANFSRVFYSNPSDTLDWAETIASDFPNDGVLDTVVGIGCSGAVLAVYIASQLGTRFQRQIRTLIIENGAQPGELSLTPNDPQFLRNKSAMIVLPAITPDKVPGIQAAIRDLRSRNANVVRVSCILACGNLDNVKFVEGNSSFHALLRTSI